jgi:hypothetical protein
MTTETVTDDRARGSSQSSRLRLVACLVGVLVLAGTALVTTASPASAADCSGSLVGHHPVRSEAGRTLAYVDIYYRSDGTNCARLNSSSLTWGERKWMKIELMTCRETSDPGRTCTPIDPTPGRYYDIDQGNFQYYAGPVSVYGRGRCIAWFAGIASPRYGEGTHYDAGHCG